MGTHSDGKSVTAYGFSGPYWTYKAEQARQEAFKAHEVERRSAKVAVEKTDVGQQEFDARGPWV